MTDDTTRSPALGGQNQDRVTGQEPLINDGRYKWVDCMICRKPVATEPKPRPQNAIRVTIVICRVCTAKIRRQLAQTVERLSDIPVVPAHSTEIIRIGNHEIPIIVEDVND